MHKVCLIKYQVMLVITKTLLHEMRSRVTHETKIRLAIFTAIGFLHRVTIAAAPLGGTYSDTIYYDSE